MRGFRAVQTAAIAALILPGCLFLESGGARDTSAAWVEPGLFEAVPESGSRVGFTFHTQAAVPGLPFPHPDVAAAWSSYALANVVWDDPGHARGGDDRLEISMEMLQFSYFVREGGPVHLTGFAMQDTARSRGALAAFLENTTSAASTTREAWVRQWFDAEGHEITIAGPFRFAELYSRLGGGTPPVTGPLEPGSQGVRLGNWTFGFLLGTKTAERREGSGTQTLTVDVRDVASFRHEGRRNLPDAQLGEDLTETFNALGLPGPRLADWRFQHVHGD